MNAIELNLFASRVAAICDEMGWCCAARPSLRISKTAWIFPVRCLERMASCLPRAAHIPVHLGSMAYAMGNLVRERDWQAGDVIMVNDPYLGGLIYRMLRLLPPCLPRTGRLCWAS